MARPAPPARREPAPGRERPERRDGRRRDGTGATGPGYDRRDRPAGDRPGTDAAPRARPDRRRRPADRAHGRDSARPVRSRVRRGSGSARIAAGGPQGPPAHWHPQGAQDRKARPARTGATGPTGATGATGPTGAGGLAGAVEGVATGSVTTSVAVYTTLPGGPSVDAVIPASGKVLVILTAEISGSNAGNTVLHRFHVSQPRRQRCFGYEFASSGRRKSSPGECDGAAHRPDPWNTVTFTAVYKSDRLRHRRRRSMRDRSP